MVDSTVNVVTGELLTGDEYADMILREYDEADKLYQVAKEGRERARDVLEKYMDTHGLDGIPSNNYEVQRKIDYSYTKHKALLEPLLKVLTKHDIDRVYSPPLPVTPADGTWNIQRLKSLIPMYPVIQEKLEMVREARNNFIFNRREDGK